MKAISNIVKDDFSLNDLANFNDQPQPASLHLIDLPHTPTQPLSH